MSNHGCATCTIREAKVECEVCHSMHCWGCTVEDGLGDGKHACNGCFRDAGREPYAIPSPVEVYRTDANEEVERMAAEFERQIEAEQALWRPVIEAGNP